MNDKKRGKTRDMTQGSALSNLLIFAIPLFISNFFQQCYNICDTMIASHNLGETALAAIGLTGSITGLVIGFANGMNNGYAILLSRAFGAKNEKQMRSVVAWTFILNTAISVVFTTLTLLFMNQILGLMQTPADIFLEAKQYAQVVLGGMAATLFYNMASGILRAVGNSRTPLYFLIFSCTINICMDLLFVTVFDFGVAGIAFATAFAQVISSVLCFIHIWKKYRFLIPEKEDFAYQKGLLGDLLTTGLSMGLMHSIFAIGSVVLQGAINTLGTTIIAAHTTARRIVMIGNMPLSSIASADATFVSQNYGAGKKHRIKDGIKTSCMLSIGWTVLYTVALMLFAENLIYMLTGSKDPVIMENAVMNLRINMIFFFPLGILLILRTALQGMGHKILPLVSSSLELIFKIIASFAFVPMWGYLGASIAEPFTWLICMVFLLVSFIRTMKKEQITSL